MPASPSFYSGAKTIEQAVDTVVARMFDQIGVENDLVRRWSGLHPEERT
jgi:4-hydroxy-3-polyprenylbenzoate decarboxylase